MEGIVGSRQLINTGIRLLTDASGDFYTSESWQPDFIYAWIIDSTLNGIPKATFEDNVVECAWGLLSSDPNELDKDAMGRCIVILTQMAAGRYLKLHLLWKKARCNNESTVFYSLLQELLSRSSSLDNMHPYKHLQLALRHMFFISSHTGYIDQANTALSSLIGMSVDFAEYLAIYLSSWWHHTCDIILYGNEETLKILERTGLLESNIVIYWKMLSPWTSRDYPNVTVWQQYMEDGIDRIVLNWLLITPMHTRFSEQQVRFLIDAGGDPNYMCSNGPSKAGRVYTPLAAALCRRETDTVHVLLERGADVMANLRGVRALSDYAAKPGMTQLAEEWRTIEREERAKKNVATCLGML